jgi:hypothetical protein
MHVRGDVGSRAWNARGERAYYLDRRRCVASGNLRVGAQESPNAEVKGKWIQGRQSAVWRGLWFTERGAG